MIKMQIIRIKTNLSKLKSMHKQMFKGLRYMIVILFLTTFVFNLHINCAETGKHVLFLNSYNWSYETVPGQLDGIREVMEREGIAFDIEFMDSKRFDTPENYENYYQFLKYRLDHLTPYDVILISDDNALVFFLEHRDELARDVPIVFFGINDYERIELASALPGVYGMLETQSIVENLDFAVALRPKAEHAYIITDSTLTGVGDARSYLSHQSDYPSLKFEAVNFSDFTLKGFEDWLTSVPENDILIYMTMLVDADGNRYTMDESVKILADYASVPVFRPTLRGLGDGLLGGYMKSYVVQGRIAAEAAVDIIKGNPMPEDHLILEQPNEYRVDYNVMEAYHLDFDVLPKETAILNRPLTLYEKYSDLIFPVVVTLGILIFVILILIFDNRRKRKTEIILRENNDELSALYEELLATDEALRDQNTLLDDSRKQLEESEKRFRELAFKDALTGMKNRMALRRDLNMILADDKKQGRLYFIDIDQFKYINDTHGHITGDEVLKAIGDRLMKIEDFDLIATRIGGDEFVVIALSSESEKMNRRRIEADLFYAFEKIIEVEDKSFHLSCSMGVVDFPKHGNNANELIRKADIALYRAKENGRARAEYYDAMMDNSSSSILGMKNSIHRALENNEFQLYLQPQICLKRNKLSGFEGLIRWYKDGETIGPIAFIPIAEQLGLIHHIGRWVLKEACADVLYFMALGLCPFKIAVNVSALEIMRSDFLENFMDTLDQAQVPPEMIVVELTESILLESKEEHLRKLVQLRNRGVEIHLDDFGTGYSSLNYLRRLPIDVVKIDREFIQTISESDEQMHLIKSIIEIAHNLGKRVIAEGVETEMQIEMLKALGCDSVQGYYFAKPLPLREVVTFINENAHLILRTTEHSSESQ